MSEYPEYEWIENSRKRTWQEVADVYHDTRKMKKQSKKKTNPFNDSFFIFQKNSRRISEEEINLELDSVYLKKPFVFIYPEEFYLLVTKENLN